ncbi:MAG: hypothetical protein Q7T14_10345 [Aestuariivirga sp.]|nr:hypothetical protein [Aestuariivirga sp.]
MAFGKRTGISDQHIIKPALAPTASEQSNTLRNVLIGVAVLLALSYLGRQAMFSIGSYVGSIGDMAMQGTSNSSFGDFVRNAEEILQQEGDKVEIAVHNKCAAPQIAALKKQSRNKMSGKEWAQFGFEERVERVSNYVSCFIADTPSRFCKPVARQRLVMAVHGYLDIQSHVLLKAKEQAEMDMGIMPAPLDKGVSDVNLLRLDPILLKIDGRIEAGIKRLISSGAVSPGDFSPGIFSSTHKGLARIISETTAGKPSCK